MNGDLTRPASVYRRPACRPAFREAAKLFSYSMRYGKGHPYVERRRAERNPPLPRNYFTRPRPPTLDDVRARMRARASEESERTRRERIRAEMRIRP